MSSYPYQDKSLSVEDRIDDLLPRLSLEEKAGLMFHMMIPANPDLEKKNPNFSTFPSTKEMLERGLTHFNITGTFDTPKEFAEFTNQLQKAALDIGRWGIPVTLSTDPRNAFIDNPQLSLPPGPFSQWCEHIGMAAIGDEGRMQEFADIVRQEYLAVGLRAALHPQADLATESRWSRTPGSLGEDADMSTRLAAAEIRGLQTKKFGHESVAACIKHFPGGGTVKDGTDPHFSWGAEQIYPGGMEMFEYHLKPFRTAVDEGVRVVMPSYGKPMGIGYEEVGMGFNKAITHDLLRDGLGFKGVVVSDWGLCVDMPGANIIGDIATARAWGVEHLSPEDRAVKCINSGCDQLGGEYTPSFIVNTVKDGRLSEDTVNDSVRRILRDKFELGLFDNPYVDVNKANKIVGNKKFKAAGVNAQMDSVCLLKNDKPAGIHKKMLPFPKDYKVYLEGFKEKHFRYVVDSPDEADVAVVRLATPWVPTGNGPFAARFHHGALEWNDDVLENIRKLSKRVPVVIEIFAERPPVLGTLDHDASAIMVSFGLSEPALVDVLHGHSPKGKLPFDLPRSTAAVIDSKTDTPFDTRNPTYRFGHGLRYD
ncbi:uncharacterized protein EHS24_007063 [Apiotrichum porosum]|uniref:beta-glucosidase n=1 Tax=Apiotrichum porosum TaxID=105984 RepID=A0A427XX22_9TREE|nr:uncharacterized protein EHS24_007063 [Apiotrichum porosum]RSH83383.1 hypothetical protein EHS24_007063 [Apiotrichum porosum]